MKFKLIAGITGIVIALIGVFFYMSTTNRITVLGEEVNASWSEVVSQYQRRADLIPNLVNTVKAYASHESQVFTEVSEARTKAGSIQVNMNEAPDPRLLKQYQQAQDQLGSSLSRLLAVSEAYPELKANENFLQLQDQLEGTENRITVARGRYIDKVKSYNIYVKTFPAKFVADLSNIQAKPQFSVENEQAISTAPKVEF